MMTLTLKIGNVNDTIFEENNVILENIEDKEGIYEFRYRTAQPSCCILK